MPSKRKLADPTDRSDCPTITPVAEGTGDPSRGEVVPGTLAPLCDTGTAMKTQQLGRETSWVAWGAIVVLMMGCGRSPGSTAEGVAQASTAPSLHPVAAAPSSSSAAARGTDKPRLPDRLNVLLLSVDALRADMPWSGYPRAIAPNLSRLAEQGVLYTHAYSPSSYTAQSVAAWMSGTLASTLYRTGVFFTSYPKSNLFFPETLKENGIRNIGWFSHLYFGRGKGIDQGFDVWEMVPGITFDPQTDKHVTSDKMYALGQKLLSDPANTGGQFFAWAHFGDPHDVYIKHKESPDFGNKNRDRYDSEVWYTDYYLGKLLDWAKTQPFWERTAVIIAADHGEAFGEHGQYRHAFDIWENLVRVPLIVNFPGVTPRRIDHKRSLLDLAPTIMELLGQKPLDGFMGKSLVGEMLGSESPTSREPIVLELTEDSNNPQRRAIIVGDYKLTVRGHNAGFSLFNITKDPAESKDLARDEPEKLTEMREIYQKTFAKIPTIAPYGGNKLESGRTANGPAGPATAQPKQKG